MPVRRALMSLYTKPPYLPFARELVRRGVELYASGGTAAYLREAGLPVISLDTLTGFSELLGGRVKTLHPRVFAGILARPTSEDLSSVEAAGGVPFDLVVVDLYPFEDARDKGLRGEELVELVDIGGVALLRAAAKAHARVFVVSSPADVSLALEGLDAPPERALAVRRALAERAFRRTAFYDLAIAYAFREGRFGELGTASPAEKPENEGAQEESAPLPWEEVLAAGGAAALPGGAASEPPSPLPRSIVVWGVEGKELRYGENPHQRGAFFRLAGASGPSLADLRLLSGKPLSYTNYLDVERALRLLADLEAEFSAPAAVVFKHASPAAAAIGADVLEAYRRAHDADPVSIFGGVVAVNRPADEALVQALAEIFLDVVLFPEGTDLDLLEPLTRKKNLRVFVYPRDFLRPAEDLDLRSVRGGLLLSVRERRAPSFRTVGAHPVPEELWPSLRLAWTVSAHVTSNAIVLARDGVTVGVGAGQPNRVGSAEIALRQAGERARGAVLASDGFLPFPDTVELARAAGVRAIVQPGGSVRDAEVIQAADAAGIAMVFTDVRVFRH
ncbi:bifunctional phosphoribosylaminoimidazolecarboxamide formyltransferase/IMP cyclohydrolase [Brockia lithotrophica]|uniref:Bifunctional purine biosynthesis protein PurH n=1 Tax=Brockia lithotrophica TaxID=933949 RepID=A0A660KUT2_9BACL|nr:bifunctional phosphoribosylaminoimidazolecarboxamide formyltransferase/IMP cyclohydrolase [Brockia lithotrophica]RKQ84743.1 IMP cyclohydrolase /phosphoribosylaminoimidazolecarboxamide formyltransferase [Brockia lithotrophica]